ncbi:MAG: mechanosensitive ion channel [Planctomycetota bacterium]|nr:mechanosensitive ion channel [Planctomycetota bacterium]
MSLPIAPRPWRLRLCAVAATASLAFAQEASVPSIEEVQAQLAAVEQLEPEAQNGQAEVLQQAIDALKRAAEVRLKTQQFESEISETPRLHAAILEELATPAVEPELRADTKLALWELESRSDQAQADLASLRTLLETLETTAQFRTQRAAELPDEIATAQLTLSAAEEALASVAIDSNNPSRRTLLLAQVDEYRAISDQLEKERGAYEARREVLPLRRDRALRRTSVAQTVANFWKAQVDERRARDGESAAKNAKQKLEEVTDRFPSLGKLATRNRELAAMRTGDSGLPRRISSARASKEQTQLQLDEIRLRYNSARARIKAGGLTEGMGSILRRDYEWLPAASTLKTQSADRKKNLSAILLDTIAREEERDAIRELEPATDRLLASLKQESPSEELRTAARELLTTQRTSVQAVVDELKTLSGIHYDTEELAVTLAIEARAYREFIEKRILWVRSAPSNPIKGFGGTLSHTAGFAREFWAQLTSGELRSLVAQKPVGLGLFLVGWLVLFLLRRLLIRTRQVLGENVRSFRSDKYIYTGRALVQSFLLALQWPALMWMTGRLLKDSQGDLLRSASSALIEVAAIWLFLRFLRELTVKNGVGLAHFKWPAPRITALNKELRWFEPISVLLGLTVLTLDRQGNLDWSDSIGRLCFIAGMLAVAYFALRLVRAEKLHLATKNKGKEPPKSPLDLRALALVGLPTALALLALAGYYYTSLQFELRLRYSIGFAALLILINALLHRWLLMARRSLAVRQAIEARARREQEEATTGDTEGTALAIDADKVDIPAIDAQTRQLFKTSISLASIVGLFFIWASVLPALRGLDSIQIFPTVAIVSPEAEIVLPATAPAPPTETATSPSTASPVGPALGGSSASPAPDSEDSSLPSNLTLADILLAIGIGMLAGFAAKNLPALLELAVLQRLPLDGGSRYAISTIVRYLILMAGVSGVSGALGIGWHQVQWLAAALTFGIAFGLQEIFANFISGLIILIERPIRVGDIVTVAGTEGRVTQLRMRATTILDWDQRELLVPNKEFITGSIINWTLSDPVTRMVIPVGIAYGSDTQLARTLLLKVAKDLPQVLNTPSPSAIFRNFGDSTLDFQLRVFIANRDLWAEITDKIHRQIDAEFRKANVEIAFPQRDLHIRSAEGLSEAHRAHDLASQPEDS